MVYELNCLKIANMAFCTCRIDSVSDFLMPVPALKIVSYKSFHNAVLFERLKTKLFFLNHS